MNIIKRVFILPTAALIFLILTSQAQALPAFARKYQTSCQTCHTVFPRKNIIGEAFRLNGFRFPDDEVYVKEEPVEMGDENYKKIWPKAIWPSDIPGTVPLNVVVNSLVEVELNDGRDNPVLFLFPEGIEINAAGTIGDNVSAYAHIVFEQSDNAGQDVENWLMMLAWIEFSDLFGPENLFNLKWGTVGTQTLGLFTSRAENEIGTHSLLYLSWGMPDLNLGANDLLTFEGNNFALELPRSGFELSGFGRRWYYNLGYVAGNVIDEQANPEGGVVFFEGASKNDPYKDIYLSLAYKIGGIGFNGYNGQLEADADTPPTLTTRTDFWRDDSLTLALFGYKGTGAIKGQLLSDPNVRWEAEDEFWRFGAGFEQKYRDLTVAGHYMAGRNENPYGSLSRESVDSTSWHIETSYWLYPWLLPYVKFQHLDLELPQDIVYDLAQDQDQSFLLLGCRYLARPNIAFATEVSKYFKGDDFRAGVDEVLFIMLSYAM